MRPIPLHRNQAKERCTSHDELPTSVNAPKHIFVMSQPDNAFVGFAHAHFVREKACRRVAEIQQCGLLITAIGKYCSGHRSMGCIEFLALSRLSSWFVGATTYEHTIICGQSGGRCVSRHQLRIGSKLHSGLFAIGKHWGKLLPYNIGDAIPALPRRDGVRPEGADIAHGQERPFSRP